MNNKRKIIGALILFIGMLFFAASPLLAQAGSNTSRRKEYRIESGKHSGRAEGTYLAYRNRIVEPNASSLRLFFAGCHLGKKSYIRMTSVKDGAEQHLNAKSIIDYRNSSASFNGEAVEVELHVAPEDKNIYFSMQEIIAGQAAVGDIGILSLCGDDNRVASANPAVGRIIWYGNPGYPDMVQGSAFITMNGAFLTAAHVLFIPSPPADDVFLEFNVPSSLSDGTIQHPPPSCQYPKEPDSTVWGGWKGPGDVQDWQRFKCSPNSETGLLPIDAQQSFYKVLKEPDFPASVRVTGYGLDITPTGDGPEGENADNSTQQTDTGDFLGREFHQVMDPFTPPLRGSRIKYNADTRPGNSGCPVERYYYGFPYVAVGIHTYGACENANYNYNWGTGFENEYLQDALNSASPANTIYADSAHPSGEESGSVWGPFRTLPSAVLMADPGDTIVIAGGDNVYTYEVSTIDKNITLRAVGGTVDIYKDQ